MITFFTTTKKFNGDTRNSQLNALRSWLWLDPGVEVIVFEKPVGIDPFTIDPRIRVDPMPECIDGIPRIDYMFRYASERAKNPYCCFINCDIIITGGFGKMIRQISGKLTGNFLAAGQRWDFDNTLGEWEFNKDWEKKYLHSVYKTIHAPAGSDYFIFPKGQYLDGSIPPLVVGRAGWDNWMIYHSRKSGYLTVDLSEFCMVYHQNHDYSHKNSQYKSIMDEPEVKHNTSYLPEGWKYDFTLLACDRLLNRNGELVWGYSRGNKRAFMRIGKALGHSGFISAFRFYRNRLLSQQQVIVASS